MSCGHHPLVLGLATILGAALVLWAPAPSQAASLLPFPSGITGTPDVSDGLSCRKSGAKRRHRRGGDARGGYAPHGASPGHRGDGRGVRVVRSGRRSAIVVAEPDYKVGKGRHHVQVPGPWSKGRHLRHRARAANSRSRLVVELPTRRNFRSAHRHNAKTVRGGHRGFGRGGGRGRR